MAVHAVLLSGGSGTRLWPLSRKTFPKQLLPLLGERSLLQQAAERCNAVPSIEEHIVVCNHEHRFMVAEQLRDQDTPPKVILLEPAPRNTAPAVALAALQSQAISGQDDSIILVFPSDHLIKDVPRFAQAAELAISLARDGHLVTFGITPNEPATGYGYIKKGSALRDSALGDEAFSVEEFVEKPDLATAKQYVAGQNHLWNSGMFSFRADVYLNELERFRPDIYKACLQSFEARVQDLDFSRVGEEEFAGCPSESIDYAVMEKTDKAVMIPMDAQWNDIGSWTAVMQESNSDQDGNVLHGDALALNTKNSYLRSSGRLVATLGVEDLLVIDTPDALLVAHREDAQSVKDIVDALSEAGRPEATVHRRVYRPWGSYETVDLAPRFQVKRIIVNPGERLSLQMHHHRAEHWIVVGGTAVVTRNEETFRLTENESTFIPLGATHRLENPGKVPLEMIEVQSGSYLGEDDIVRFEDGYGRA